jgi:succinoglycan biosynthesis protein ExoO
MNPLVSVLVAAYNSQDTIGEAISSVLNQTVGDFEIIVVDDCSSDGTADAVGELRDSRIRLLRHETNRGPGAARNSALAIARGTWATVVDADDAWHPERLEVLLKAADVYPHAILGDDILLCLQTTGNRMVPWMSSLERNSIKLPHELTPYDLATLIRHEIDLKPFFPLQPVLRLGIWQWEEAFGAEWLHFIARFLHAGYELVLIRRALYYYRLSGRGLSTTYGELLREIMVCEKLLCEEWVDHSAKSALRDRRRFLDRRRPLVALRSKLWVTAVRDFWRFPSSLLLLIQKVPERIRRILSQRFGL